MSLESQTGLFYSLLVNLEKVIMVLWVPCACRMYCTDRDHFDLQTLQSIKITTHIDNSWSFGMFTCPPPPSWRHNKPLDFF